MIDLNISKNYDLVISNGKITTDASKVSAEELYITRLIERVEIHYEKNKVYDDIFDFNLYVGLSDEEIEIQIKSKLYTLYKSYIDNFDELVLIEIFKAYNNVLVFYKYIPTNTYISEENGKPYKIYY